MKTAEEILYENLNRHNIANGDGELNKESFKRIAGFASIKNAMKEYAVQFIDAAKERVCLNITQDGEDMSYEDDNYHCGHATVILDTDGIENLKDKLN